jgi:transposase
VAVADNEAGLVGVPRSCTPTRAMTTAAAAPICTSAGSKYASPDAGSRTSPRLGRVRWVVERTISWLLRFKRLGLRYDRTERTTLPLLTLACTVINTRRLIKNEL